MSGHDAPPRQRRLRTLAGSRPCAKCGHNRATVAYDPEMIRSLMVTVFAVTLSFLSVPVVADAEPADPPCTFTLSAPHVVQVSGTDMVAVTMSPSGCDGGTPYQSIACVELQGNTGPENCVQNNGLLTARAYYSPYQPGATYVATGRGCSTSGNPPEPVCEPSGPLAATL